ncbi:hypothetical protein [Asticcacaulis excentricus]|uniref:Uncharacterized protein n=1 Tax=Asticcacaulis excentricus TaxID=78587 RepID=A0A3G9FXY3_9CAUL|nr:hypothetical protein [Asticcacaulis excentricus]BBF79900.1 hypothetical protein EM6_0477 [Asticcacaulis excentricus]
MADNVISLFPYRNRLGLTPGHDCTVERAADLAPHEQAEFTLMNAACHAKDPEFRDLLMKKADDAALPKPKPEPSDLQGYYLPFNDRPATTLAEDLFALFLFAMAFLSAAMAIGDLLSRIAAAVAL